MRYACSGEILLHSHALTPPTDARRIAGAGLLLLGSTIFACALSVAGSLQWVHLPRTATLGRTLVFALTGLVLGLGGYRLASGTWVGSLQVPHRATALAGLLFLGYAAKTMLFNTTRPQSPPLWMLATAVLALLSWSFAGRHRRTWR
jgi:hypothetical protein